MRFYSDSGWTHSRFHNLGLEQVYRAQLGVFMWGFAFDSEWRMDFKLDIFQRLARVTLKNIVAWVTDKVGVSGDLEKSDPLRWNSR